MKWDRRREINEDEVEKEDFEEWDREREENEVEKEDCEVGYAKRIKDDEMKK